MGRKSKKLHNKISKRSSIDSEDRRESTDSMPTVLSDVDYNESDKSGSMSEENASQTKQKAREHMKQLQRLEEKDPEFYQFLKDYDKELLEFNDEEFDEDA